MQAAPSTYNAREFVASLIAGLTPPEAEHEYSPYNSNPLRDLPETNRHAFLTLYALFEKELLPALDLLDRGLVTRLIVKTADDTVKSHNGSTTPTYIVRSAQHQTPRNQAQGRNKHHEVRLHAWSCSCPAFVFSAFPATAAAERTVDFTSDNQCLVGGLTRGCDIPVCKHLLACLLTEHCAMLTGFVKQREVSVEELAGWAAQWDD